MNGSGMTLKEMSSDILSSSAVASTPCPRLSTPLSLSAPALETLADDDAIGSTYTFLPSLLFLFLHGTFYFLFYEIVYFCLFFFS